MAAWRDHVAKWRCLCDRSQSGNQVDGLGDGEPPQQGRAVAQCFRWLRPEFQLAE